MTSETSNIFNLIMIGGFFGSVSYYLINNPSAIFNSIGRYLWYSPGVGSVTLQKKGKKKFGVVNTELGEMKVPIMKMSSFENVYGFFSNDSLYPLGLFPLDTFEQIHGGNFPPYESFNNIGDNLILNYRRPSDFNGKDHVYGFIKSEIDGLVYVYRIDDNKLIDYESIDSDYIEKIENYQPGEMEVSDTEESINFLKSISSIVNNQNDIIEEEDNDIIEEEDEGVEDNNDVIKEEEKETEGFLNVSQYCINGDCSTDYKFDREYRVDDPEFNPFSGCDMKDNSTNIETKKDL